MSEPLPVSSDAATAAIAAVRAAEAQRLSALRDKSISDATWSAYLGAWDRWATWAAAHGRQVLPADPHDLGAWANEAVFPTTTPATTSTKTRGMSPAGAESPARGISASTLAKWMAAVAFVHRRAGHPNRMKDDPTRTLPDTLKGLRREMADTTSQTQKRQVPALMLEDIQQILAAMDGTSLRDVRDRALILLAFASAMRASELAALNVADLEPDEAGLIVRIRTSKTDQEGAGAFVAIPFARNAQQCPVRALDEWLHRMTGLLTAHDQVTAPPTPTAAELREAWWRPKRRPLAERRRLIAGLDGAVLRSVRGEELGTRVNRDPHQARLSRQAIHDTITARARTAGLQAPEGAGRYFSAHSTRSGFATQATDNGVSLHDLMEHGRWKSASVARSYVRRGTLLNDHNAAGHLGL